MNVFDSLRHLKSIVCIVQAYVDGVNNKMFFVWRCLGSVRIAVYTNMAQRNYSLLNCSYGNRFNKYFIPNR